jgi:hypothetical protein
LTDSSKPANEQQIVERPPKGAQNSSQNMSKFKTLNANQNKDSMLKLDGKEEKREIAKVKKIKTTLCKFHSFMK